MRIATVGPHDHDETFSLIIARELRELGHQVATVDSRPKLGNRTVGKIARRVGDLARLVNPELAAVVGKRIQGELHRFQPDLVITVQGFWSAAELDAWRRAAPGSQIVWWFPDHIANLDGQRFLTAGFDRIFLKDRIAVEALRDGAGVDEVRFLPQGCRTRIPDSWEGSSDDFGVGNAIVVASNYYPSRLRVLEHVASESSFALFGNTNHLPESLQDSDRRLYLTGRDKYVAFGHARGVLNDQHFAEVGGVNLRLFEAARAGALVITRSNPVLSEYFEAGTEVLAYSSVEELVAILQSDLGDAKVKMGPAAQGRAIAEHTLGKRLESLLEVVNG